MKKQKKQAVKVMVGRFALLTVIDARRSLISIVSVFKYLFRRLVRMRKLGSQSFKGPSELVVSERSWGSRVTTPREPSFLVRTQLTVCCLSQIGSLACMSVLDRSIHQHGGSVKSIFRVVNGSPI